MDWKKFGKKLLFPPVWLMVLLAVFSTASLVLIFVRGWEMTAAAYGVYLLSAYSLSVVTIFCIRVLPKQWRIFRQKIYSTALGSRYMTDRAFRTNISLHLSLAISLVYVAVNLWSWHLFHSWWFVVLAVYYGILAVMRFLLVRYVRIHAIGSSILGEWQRARSCACILLLINLSLSGAVLMILFQNRGYDYPGILIYVMALYTFYSVIHTIVDIVKYRKLGSPILSTAKIVSLSAALVSLLNLETAMFAQFGADMAFAHKRIFIILTGAGVSSIVITLSAALIFRGTRKIRRIKDGKS